MNIKVDTDLAKQARKIAKNNGISTGKYINNLLEKALKSELQLAKSQQITERQRRAADTAWMNYKFPKNISIEDSDSWDITGGFAWTDWVKIFYYLDKKRPSESTRRGRFRITFTSRNVAVISCTDENGAKL